MIAFILILHIIPEQKIGNNDYVDSKDVYRHSKWLSMMKNRLYNKNLLNMDNSVLIVTIDEKEYLHLGCLLEEMFSSNIQWLVV